MQINVSNEMIATIVDCFATIDSNRLESISNGSPDYEVNGLDAQDFFRELQKIEREAAKRSRGRRIKVEHELNKLGLSLLHGPFTSEGNK